MRGAADLQGLLLFLGIEPYASSAQVLEQCLIRPAEAGDISARTALLALVHTIMWRSVKAQLVERNELKLLPPITEVIPLQLSPMEQGFYSVRSCGTGALRAWQRLCDGHHDHHTSQGPTFPALAFPARSQHEFSACAEVVQPVLARWRAEERMARAAGSPTTMGLALSAVEVDAVVTPLRRVLQACVHPQIGRLHGFGAFRAVGVTTGGRGQTGVPLPISLLHGKLMVQNRADAEAAQRDVVFCRNGIAGLLALQGDTSAAIAEYETVVALPDDLSPCDDATVGSASAAAAATTAVAAPESVRVDPLQRLHALRGLLRLRQRSAASSGAAAAPGADALLTRRAEILEDNYLRARAMTVGSAWESLATAVRETLARTRMNIDWSSASAAPLQSPQLQLTAPAVAESVEGAASAASDSTDAGRPAKVPLYRKGHAVHIAEVRRVLTSVSIHDACLKVALLVSLHLLDMAETASSVARAQILLAATGDFTPDERLRMQGATNGPTSSGGGGSFSAVSWPVASLAGVKSVLVGAISDLATARTRAFEALAGVLLPDAAALRSASQCGVCNADWGNSGPACFRCKLRPVAELLQTSLYRSQGDAAILSEPSASRQLGDGVNTFLSAAASTGALQPPAAVAAASASTAPTAVVRVLTALAAAFRRVPLDITDVLKSATSASSRLSAGAVLSTIEDSSGRVVVDASEWLDGIIIALRAEAKLMCKAYDAQGQLLSALDELATCVVYMELSPDRRPDDTRPLPLNFVHRSDVAPQLSSLRAQLMDAQDTLAKRLALGRFLRNAVQGSAADGVCVICGHTFAADVFVIKACAHRFCAPHLDELVAATRIRTEYGRQALKCPICRVVFDAKSGVAVAHLHASSDANTSTSGVVLDSLDASVHPEHASGGEMCADRGLVASSAGARHSSGISLSGNNADRGTDDNAHYAADSVQVVDGDYGTKITALIRAILELSRRHTQSLDPGFGDAARVSSVDDFSQVPFKCIVFSQWSDAVEIVEAALERNGITAVRVKKASEASSTVARFASILGPRPVALLMTFNSGAAGLNITVARHVFLLEPLLDPSVEAQAVGRVDRLGQTGQTYIHRLVIQDSVEDAVRGVAAARAARRRRAADIQTSSAGSQSVARATRDSLTALALSQTIAGRRLLRGAVAAHEGGALATLHDDERSPAAGGGVAASTADDVEEFGAVGLTRDDVICLWDRETRAQRRFLAQGRLSAQPAAQGEAHGDDIGMSAAPSGNATALSRDGDAARDGHRNAGQASARVDADTAQRLEAAIAARNHAFWGQQRVIAPCSARPVLRVVALSEVMRAAGAAGATRSASQDDDVNVFGRCLPRAIARALLAMPHADMNQAHAMSNVAGSRTVSEGASSARSATDASIDSEIAALVRTLAGTG